MRPAIPTATWKVPEIESSDSGNLEVLRGALGLAEGLRTGDGIGFTGQFSTLSTEGISNIEPTKENERMGESAQVI